jgi:hypothetical protein
MRIFVITIILSIVSMSTVTSSLVGQKEEGSAVQQRRMMVGAYAEVTDPDRMERLAAVVEFVQNELVAIASSGNDSLRKYSFSSQVNAHQKFEIAQAFQQVVAGMNYRLLLVVSDQENDNSGRRVYIGAFTVTVYDHFGDLSLTLWGREMELSKALAILKKEKEGVYVLADSDFQE